MPVIINELEVIAAPPPREAATAPGEPAVPAGPTPEDIQAIILRLVSRELRVYAG